MRVGRQRSTGRIYLRNGRVCAEGPPCYTFDPTFGWDGSYVDVDCYQCSGVVTRLPTVMVAHVQVIEGACACMEGYFPLVYWSGGGAFGWVTQGGVSCDGSSAPTPTGYLVCPTTVVNSWWGCMNIGFACNRIGVPGNSWGMFFQVLSFLGYGEGYNGFQGTCFEHGSPGDAGTTPDSVTCDPFCLMKEYMQVGSDITVHYCPCQCGSRGINDPPIPPCIRVRVTITTPDRAGYSCDGSFAPLVFPAGSYFNHSGTGVGAIPCGCCGDGGGSGSGTGERGCAGCTSLSQTITILFEEPALQTGLEGQSMTVNWDPGAASDPFVQWDGTVTLPGGDGNGDVTWTGTLHCDGPGNPMFFDLVGRRGTVTDPNFLDCIANGTAAVFASCDPLDAYADITMGSGCPMAAEGTAIRANFSA